MLDENISGRRTKSGAARSFLLGREARTKMAGNNEAAERTEIPALGFPQERDRTFEAYLTVRQAETLCLSFYPRVRVVDHFKGDPLSPRRYRYGEPPRA